MAGTPDLSKQAWVIDHLVTSITLEDSGKDVREVTAEIKVLQEAGVKQFAVLNFTFTRANETVDVDYVRVRKPDGSVVTTPEYNIQDMPADITRTAPMYSDIHEKHVAVKGLGIGDTLEYRIHYRTLTPQIPGQAWYAFNMSKSEIIRDERIELTVPKAKHITVKSPEFKPEISDQGDLRTYKWKYTNLQLKEDEQTASNRTTPPPDVQVSTFASWDEIGHWYSELQHDRVTVTPALAAKAAELTKGLTTDDAKLRALYDFVSLHIHYVGLDFGVGRFQPHSADDVLSNEYGDCKDKHTLLAALLHAAGFEAWPVLIHSSQKLDPEVPSPAQFDHVITAVPVGQNLVWLDTTAEVAPYGLLMPQLRDKQALVIATGKPAVIMSTPANPPFPQEQRFEAKAKLGSDGVLHAHITQQYRGDVEVALRATLRQIPEARWQEAIQGFSRGIGFAGDVSDVVISPIDDLDKPLVISYDYLRKDYADWEHKQILTLLPPIGIEGSASDSAKQPKEPLYMGAVGDLVYHSEIELPPGSSLTPPKDVNLVEPYAEYHTQNVFEGGKLETTRRLLLKKTEVPVADWDSFKKMAKAASDDSFNYIPLRGLDSANSTTASSAGLDLKFKEAADALQQRDSRRAMELLQQVIAADPKYRGAHFNLAFAFAQSGRADDALEELQKEEEVNPDDPRSYQAAASLAVFARKRDLAVAQLQKLLKLDPKNRDGAIRLASLLSEEGKDKESVEVLEPAVRLSPDSSSLQFALGTAYLKTEDAAKAVPHLQSAAEMAEKAAPLDYMQLNNIAYSLADANADLELSKHCIEKALTELDARSNSDPTDPQSKMELTRDHALLWDTAGWIYFRLGDLKAAEDYVRAAWVLGQDGVVGEHLGEIYERLGMKKEAARTYELAVAAMPIPPAPYMAPPRMGNNLIGTESALKLAKSRYQKLMGKQMNINSFDRLPNGTWPVSPFDELNQLRTAKLGTQPGPDGYADFEVKFDSKGSQVATFLTGNSAMKSLTKRLELAKFKVEFPAGSKAVLYRRVTVHCSKLAPCSAVVLPSNIVFAPPT
ncbi:MAG TPA: DUF3857 domain-containing protein [Terriglobales bacterium]|nr:DUF3857 domain-containing protein [Terriglobales bacterium]